MTIAIKTTIRIIKSKGSVFSGLSNFINLIVKVLTIVFKTLFIGIAAKVSLASFLAGFMSKKIKSIGYVSYI